MVLERVGFTQSLQHLNLCLAGRYLRVGYGGLPDEPTLLRRAGSIPRHQPVRNLAEMVKLAQLCVIIQTEPQYFNLQVQNIHHLLNIVQTERYLQIVYWYFYLLLLEQNNEESLIVIQSIIFKQKQDGINSSSSSSLSR